ncbi:MAG: flagellar FliJ family protein [Acidobacteriota bacterium]
MLTRIQLEMARVQHEIEHVTAEIVAAQKAREECMRHPIPAAQLQAMLHGADAAVERKKKLLEAMAALEQKRGEQMRLYQEAHRARQVLTELLGKQREAWEQEQGRAQQKMLDDIFASRNMRS